jgi:hypothetical protein
MVACEVSGAREHGHDLKQEHQVEGPIMQAKEWTSGARRHKGHKGEMIVLRERTEPVGLKASRPLIRVLVINDKHYGLTILFEL